MKKETDRAAVLLVEDDAAVAGALRRLLEDDYLVEAAATAEEGIARAQSAEFDVVVTDLQMPGLSGLDVIKVLHQARPRLPIILMTAYHTTDTAIEATKLGAYDYVLKPIPDPKEFLEMVQKAVASTATAKAQPVTARKVMDGPIIGCSQAMQKVYKTIGRVAGRPVTVLIRGETGTGKELVARALHQYGDRADKPFVIVNCVAIPETLLESELFGHEQGAFTGAQALRIGKFEQANRGTLFLDEIGDISLSTQAKLLRVLQEKAIQRVGGKETIQVDVRVIAATHRDLEEAVEQKKFRADLYYRLNDAVIDLPALRARREDIPDLAKHFLRQHESEEALAKSGITTEALTFLQYRPWPGNVRELKNVMHQALVLAQGRPIDPTIIRRALVQPSPVEAESKQTLQAYVAELLEDAERGRSGNVEASLTEWAERELYAQALRLAEGDQSKIVKWLGISRPTVRERLMRYGLLPGLESTAQNQET